MKHLASLLTLVAVLLATASMPMAQAQEPPAVPAWDKETVALFAKLPVQDGGRVKPMDTFAQFTMLRLNGVRALRLPDGAKLGPTEWLMNCMFYPEAASDYEHFIVDASDAITALGIEAHDKKRDRYSYNELLPARSTLFQLAAQYAAIEEKDRTRVEIQVLNLANNVHTFEQLIHFFRFAEQRFTVSGDTQLAKAFPEADGVPLSAALERSPKVLTDLRAQSQNMSSEQLNAEVNAFSELMSSVDSAVATSDLIALLPPPNAADKVWRSPATAMETAFDLSQPSGSSATLLASLEKLPSLVDDRAAFRQELQKLQGAVALQAADRGEYAKIALEYNYYKGKYIFYSQWLFVLSFVLVAISWLVPGNKWLQRAITPAILLPTVLLIVGITMRCIIRSRPPVSTLYETILFITAVVVIVGLIIEYMNRQRIAIAMASFLGAVGMFIAYRYEVKEAVDTMPSLVAVLDTNFWLSTHVTTVTTGYAAGLLAGGLAHIYIFGKAFGFRKGDTAFYKSVAKMVYGVVCFGLIFATVGTILGGIWANDSWGRFWGWDPKENGALMIVLWCLVILHAKMGRYIKELGISITSVILAMIVAFSWWGVNLLGVGLHSYGFTQGIMRLLMVYWGFESAVVAIGIYVALRERAFPPAEPDETPPAKPRGKRQKPQPA